MPRVVTTINGRFVSNANARISVYDNSLLYAEGLFETFLAIGDRLAFPKEHLQRLHKGARFLRLKVPALDSTLIDWLTKTASKHKARFKRVRLTMTGGNSPVWQGKTSQPQIICSAIEHKFDNTPLKIFAPAHRVDNLSAFNRIKTISFGSRAASLREARQRKCDDALLINNQGEISELTSANIFWVKKGRIYTPPLSAGCLEGVTRRVLLEQGKKKKWNIIEKSCSLKDLKEAGEVFTTSSVRLVRPVAEIRASEFKAFFKSGPVWEMMFSHLCQMLKI